MVINNRTHHSKSNDNPDEAFDRFHEKVLSVIDSVAPYESFTLGKQMYHKEPWLPDSLLKNSKKQKILYKKTISRSNTALDHESYSKQSDKTSLVECLEDNGILYYSGNKNCQYF